MGLLKVKGTLAKDRYWPHARTLGSDADTACVTVDLGEVTFNGEKTNVLEQAFVRRQKNKTPDYVLNKKGEMTVRLQHIDAPELHFRPSVKNEIAAIENHEWRQAHAERVTTALVKHLFGTKDAVPCEVHTEVDEPNDVFDVYGRFVGDLWVDGSNLNLWLLHEGLVFPAVYASASKREVREVLKATQNGRGSPLWRSYEDEIFFEDSRIWQKEVSADDNGPVLFPKIFRRVAKHVVESGDVSGFKAYMDRQKEDAAYRMRDFLQQGPAASLPVPMATFIDDQRADSPIFTRQPEELVFLEKSSTLRRGPDGEKITEF